MEANSSRCIATVDRNGVPYNVRLKRVREAVAKQPQKMAALVGLSIAEYYDWENCGAELSMVASLAELSRLATVLGIRTRRIFEDDLEPERSISFKLLCAKIKEHLIARNMSVAAFEHQVGFEIAPALCDSSEIFKWNVDCLRFVCQEIAVDWLAALP